MSVIAYDRPVADFISRLDATGHVSHRAYRKTSVTLHHNGGRLSHQGVLDVWKARPASAHFDSDSSGAIAQYVRVNEYAWGVGNTGGNQSSISIEMANATTSPHWDVTPTTWGSAARLAGWLFARVIGTRPHAGNFFMHSHWSSTACAGPSTRAQWSAIMTAAQAAYDQFVGAKHTTPPAPQEDVMATLAEVQTAVTAAVASQKDEIATEVWNRFKVRGPGGELLSLTDTLSRLLAAADKASKP